jgi:polyhydroxybutyrate depolymerase
MGKLRLHLLLGLAGLTALTCSRSNLDAIRRLPAPDSGSSGTGGSGTGGSGTGGSGTGGSGTGGLGTGGSGTGGSGTGGRGTGGSGTGGSGTGGSAPCPLPALQPGETTETIQVGSLGRSYILKVPTAYDGSKRVPLILDFHSLAVTASTQKSLSLFPAQTAPEGVVMVFPNGMSGPMGPAWNVGPCCVSPVNGVAVDDVAFAKAIVSKVSSTACIDSKRVYAVGFSMGGGMAYEIACRAAEVFAAISPASFDMSIESAAACSPRRPVTVIAFRGTADTLVPYNGGPTTVVPGMPVTFMSAQADFQKWAELDGCTGSPSPPDGNGCSSYTACKEGAEVILCAKPGGGQEQGNAGIAWPVLKRHALP